MVKLAKVFLSKFVALILLKIAPCRRKENRVTLQARSVRSRGRDLESQISPRVGKNQSSGVKPRHFVKEGANARMRHGYREVLPISQAGSGPDNELSLKVSLPRESSSWANVSALSFPICGASDLDEVKAYWSVECLLRKTWVSY